MEIVLQMGLLAAGFLMLIKGADWFVEGASAIADRLGIPQIVIGLTIVAMGTSAPEAAISISSALKGSADIAVGNVLGSNILNVFVILGITSLIAPLSVKKTTVRYEIPFVIIISVVFAVIGLADNKIAIGDSLILIMLFVVYLIYLYIIARGSQENEPKSEVTKKKRISIMLLLGVSGCLLIILGSNVAVDAATRIAKICGMSERIIGLTIVAFGTSLPELVTSAMAAGKGNTDIAIGNIVGSNIFNILFVIGISAMITDVAYQKEFFADSIICIGSVAVLLLCLLNKKHRLNRIGGTVMLLGYGAYFAYLVC